MLVEVRYYILLPN